MLQKVKFNTFYLRLKIWIWYKGKKIMHINKACINAFEKGNKN